MKILLILALILQCSIGNKETKLPELLNINKEYCSENGEVNEVGSYVQSIIGNDSWEDYQAELVEKNSPEANQLSIKLQKARAIIATCAVILFDAVPTGSARNLSDINTKNALKDIDMSIPVKNNESANQWLKSIVKKPDKTLALALLMNPLETIPCRFFNGKDLEECGKVNTLETTQLMLTREFKLSGKVLEETHFAKKEDIDLICPNGFLLPEDSHKVHKIIGLKNTKDLEKFIENMPDQMSSENGFTSKNRIYFYYSALKNPAYYLQSESLRRWVVQREDVFQKELQEKYPAYASGKGILEIEKDGAALEQYMNAMRYKDSLYYKNKYMFRAMDHIGFDIDKKIPEFSAIHRLLKKTRPDTIQESYEFINKMIESKEIQKELSLKRYYKEMSFSDFEKLVKDSDKMQMDALIQYYDTRKKDKNSIWPKVCKI